MNKFDNLWAGWRNEYVTGQAKPTFISGSGKTLFENIDEADLPDEETLVIEKRKHTMTLLNAYPYTSGHLLVVPRRPINKIDDLSDEEYRSLWLMVRDAGTAIQTAFSPQGINIGLNEGEAAGAGVPEHIHVHVLPRWSGDTNFMTTTANTRVVPESLVQTWKRLKKVWPEERWVDS